MPKLLRKLLKKRNNRDGLRVPIGATETKLFVNRLKIFAMERIIVVIPTFNEPDLLEQTVDSLEHPTNTELVVLIANAGAALPENFSSKVKEIAVESHNWWTGQMQFGLDEAKNLNPDWILFLNADTTMIPGAFQKLLDFVRAHPDKIACCPAYERQSDGLLKLQYSHQLDWGFLLYGKLVCPWETSLDAPTTPFRVDLTGGQGTLFSGEFLEKFKMDSETCPHYGGDHDFWLTLRKAGHELWLVPQAGIVNDRQFGGMLHSSFSMKLKGLWKRLTNRLYPESIGLMWRFRKKHLKQPIALVSFVCAFLIRWTLGLPKMLKRL